MSQANTESNPNPSGRLDMMKCQFTVNFPVIFYLLHEHNPSQDLSAIGNFYNCSYITIKPQACHLKIQQDPRQILSPTAALLPEDDYSFVTNQKIFQVASQFFTYHTPLLIYKGISNIQIRRKVQHISISSRTASTSQQLVINTQ